MQGTGCSYTVMSQNTKYMFQTFQNAKNHRKTPSEHGFININVNLASDGSQFRAGSWKGMGARPLREYGSHSA